MDKRRIPLISIVLAIAGVVLIVLSIADKVNTSLGFSGLILCVVGAAIRLRMLSKRKGS